MYPSGALSCEVIFTQTFEFRIVTLFGMWRESLRASGSKTFSIGNLGSWHTGFLAYLEEEEEEETWGLGELLLWVVLAVPFL